MKALCGADVAVCADGLRRDAASGAVRFEEAEGGGVDAEMVGGGVFEEGLRVDGAGEMHVQVGALGHLLRKAWSARRALLCGVEGADGALFPGVAAAAASLAVEGLLMAPDWARTVARARRRRQEAAKRRSMSFL